MKKNICALAIVLTVSSTCWAAGLPTLNTSIVNSLGIGFYQSGTDNVGVLSWHPDIRLGILGVGLDVNLPTNTSKPAGFDSLVLRFVELDTGNSGIRYGVLSNITLGYGLLVSGYSTNVSGGSILSNNQTGVKGYIRNEKYGIEALSTKSNVIAGRLTEKVLPWLVLGQTYATDKNQSSYGLDGGIPLNDWSGFYAEYARLNNHGGGMTAGFGAGQDFTILAWNFKAERRILDANFAPGYFNEQHDIDPINLVSLESSGTRKDGYLVSLGGKVFDLASINAVYENYLGTNPALQAEASAKFYNNFFAYGKFSQPNFQDFRSLNFEEGSVFLGKVSYKINPFTTLVTNYKKAYDTTQAKVVESYWYELLFNF